ncbi:MAG TPA: peptidoglycan editing factor PgeF [Candidatus Moranbacteria bacterium]|nr:peptidoglycan editing factor PgeF [Candidatus Moranbacteria bacterium]
MIKFFQNIPEILAVMSEREDGSMKLFKDSDLNLENRKRFFEKIGIGENKIIAAEIVHGIKVEIVNNSSPNFILEADGLITRDKNIFLSATMADCIPVYLYESEKKIIGVIHCGWRGIVSGIIGNAIKETLSIGGKTENLKIALGPGINSCHFEIKDDVLDRFGSYPEFVIRREGKIFVDLKGIIKEQMVDLGIDYKNIENNEECTMEDDRYFSFRRDKPKVTEAMVAVIGLK